MKNIYLASSIAHTGAFIGKNLNKDKQLSLVFINTAAEPDKGDLTWLEDDRNGLVEGGFHITDYSITGKSPKDIENDLSRYDVIHVNGGNSFYLLIQSIKSGFDKWIVDAVKNGKTYIGSSAGAITASSDVWITSKIETQTFEDELRELNQTGIGLVDVIILPHWGSDSFKELYLNQRLDVAYKTDNKIVLLNDYQFLKTDCVDYEFIDIRE